MQGPAERMDQLHRREPITGRIDLSGASKNIRNYPVNLYENNQFVTDKPLRTSVTIDEVMEKTMPVVADTRGDLSDPDLVLKKPLVTKPSQVVVWGAKALVDRVARVVATLDLAAVNTESPKTTDIELKLQDEQGQEVRQSVDVLRVQPFVVSIYPTLMPAPVEKEFVVSASVEGAPAEGFVTEAITVTPSKVILDGPSISLAQLRRLSTERIDITNLSETKRFTVKLILPANTQVKGNANRIAVEVRIRKVGSGPSVDRNTTTP